MILFCDTSALVKLYIAEQESGALTAHLLEAEAVAVCRIAWAEAHAALSRRAREVPEDAATIEQPKAALAADWSRYVILEINQSLVERAGEYADIVCVLGYAFEQSSQAAGYVLLGVRGQENFSLCSCRITH